MRWCGNGDCPYGKLNCYPYLYKSTNNPPQPKHPTCDFRQTGELAGFKQGEERQGKQEEGGEKGEPKAAQFGPTIAAMVTPATTPALLLSLLEPVLPGAAAARLCLVGLHTWCGFGPREGQ